ncbi:hypothetical protein FRB94_002934 [Tulasnella sp. JGI-2019a]|nr:hypothetical protein FRB93_013140 [Tulasnella sp. JGI-2019a]KAG9013406.1 hypothetical protein FRB94_002934 [Tulasnella sp. JGI-2019a]
MTATPSASQPLTPHLHLSYPSTRAFSTFNNMSSNNNENGAVFGALHDYCRTKNIPFSFTAVQDEVQNATTWTASVMLNEDRGKLYVAVGKSKRAALSTAAEMAIVDKNITLPDSSKGSN